MPPKKAAAANVGAKPSNRKIKKKDEDDGAEVDDVDLMGGGKKLIKPEDQLDLTEAELKKEVTRILTANNPNAPQNIVRFSFKEGAFKQTTSVDQIVMHFSYDGNMLHKDSDEARRQKAKEEDDEGSGEEGQSKPKTVLRNQFNFSERAAQTFNNPFRERSTETDPPPRSTFSATANQWKMFDAYEEHRAEQEKLKAKESSKGPGFKKDDDKKKKKLLASEGAGDDINRVGEVARIIERMINQNTFDDIAQDFAFFEDASDEFRADEGTLLPLWKFGYEKSKRMAVTGCAWNPDYADMFAVGHGSYDFTKQGGGVLLIYTLKNPSYPEFIYNTPSGVMCLDIHPKKAFLICVGFYDGNVGVFNILEKTRTTPTFMSTAKSGKHTDPVWCVKWQPNDLDDNLNFFSTSSDGKVGAWTLVKEELVFTEVISLKNEDVVQPVGPDGSQLQILGCGSVMGFHPNIDYLFLVGTEEGKIHKCSKAYSTQYLYTFQAHDMSVDTIKFNPYLPDIYLTCSADWTVKMWDNNYGDQAMFTFDLNAAVADVAWAPYSSTVFAAITIDGKAHVFDLNVNKYDSLCQQTVVQKKKTKLTHCEFNPSYPVLMVGDERGYVTTLKLSPNLRKKQKRKKAEMHLPPDPAYEVSKLDKIVSLVRDPAKKQT